MVGVAISMSGVGAPARDAFVPDAGLAEVCIEAAREVVTKYADKGLKADEVALTVVRLSPKDGPWPTGSYRGSEPFYSASVIKLFYLAYAAAHNLEVTPEQDRAFTDMIVDSSNEATMAVVDLLTNTTSGPELSPRALRAYGERRNTVNRWLTEVGFTGINCNQKTYGEGPYGRERQFVGKDYDNRNSLTSDATARMIALCVEGRIASPAPTEWMRKLLKREIPAENPQANSQARLFTGKTLPKGAQLWSKAGWTDTVRHDAALVQFPNGARFALGIFTKAHSGEANLVSDLANALWSRLAVK